MANKLARLNVYFRIEKDEDGVLEMKYVRSEMVWNEAGTNLTSQEEVGDVTWVGEGKDFLQKVLDAAKAGLPGKDVCRVEIYFSVAPNKKDVLKKVYGGADACYAARGTLRPFSVPAVAYAGEMDAFLDVLITTAQAQIA